MFSKENAGAQLLELYKPEDISVGIRLGRKERVKEIIIK